MSASDDFVNSDDLDGIESAFAGYHMWLLIDAGLVKGSCLDTGHGKVCRLRCLTWEGCEFLDNIRKDATWEKIKETAQQKGLELTFESVGAIAKSFLMHIFS